MKKYILHGEVAPGKLLLDYEKELNEEQLKVVTAADGPILVIAGAGSGKTRVVTYRVAHLLERGISPHAILLLTFTNKAAREMLHRIERLIKMDTHYIWGGTFHHIGNLILRQNSRRVGYSPISSYSTRRREGHDRPGDQGSQDRYEGEAFSQRSGAEGGLQLFRQYPHEPRRDGRPQISVLHGYPREIDLIQRGYEEKKRASNAMDFDDLLYYWHRILGEDESLRKQYATTFSHILVDEYQDTNRIQAEIVDFMGLINRNVTVVGDDAQSVYSFRGANFRNILEFPKRYPEARVFRLETNYRSTPEILDLANHSISHNTRQFEKNLRAVKVSGVIPVVTSLRDVLQQSEFVAQRILELRGTRECP